MIMKTLITIDNKIIKIYEIDKKWVDDTKRRWIKIAANFWIGNQVGNIDSIGAKEIIGENR